ncbi:MAG: ABC transporter permease [Anaerolineaceae bacterium]|nr:ABC transporter permease [Anaerolineaceae bacterium]
MSEEKKDEIQEKPTKLKKDAGTIFFDEVSKSPIAVTILAILTGLILGGVLIAATSEDVYAAFNVSVWKAIGTAFEAIWTAYAALFKGAFGDPAKIANALGSGDQLAIRRAINPFFESLVQSTPYIFAGLAVALGFRTGLFNIGAEGQIFVGAITAVTAAVFIKGVPAIIHVPLSMLAGALGGALWGMIPGWLKVKTGGHEVINTIMMNYIAFRLNEYVLRGYLHDPDSAYPISSVVPESAQLYKFFKDPIRFHLGFFIALALAFVVYWFLFKTTWGFELRTVGSNPKAARYAGMNIMSTTVLAMGLSGALAGLAGANEILGVNHRLAMAFTSGYGFDSIALALLGKNHPLGVVLAALLFGFLRNGATKMQLASGIPIDIISVLQAMILAFIAAPAIIRTIYRLRKPDVEEAMTVSSWGRT